MGRAHMNQILDTRTYQVECARGEVTDLTINNIAYSMYAQCDTDRNKYLLPDTLVDYHKDIRAISLAEQQTIILGITVTHKTTAGWQICCQWNSAFIQEKRLDNHHHQKMANQIFKEKSYVWHRTP